MLGFETLLIYYNRCMTHTTGVSFVRCKDYEPEVVDAALDAALEPLGGICAFVKPGQKVFLKVNLLLAAAPEAAITTHPAVVEAVIRAVQAAGAEPFFGDLPGGFHVGNTRRLHDKCGMTGVAERTGAGLVFLEQHGFRERPIPNGKKLNLIHTPKFLDCMDVLINLPKLKTHMQSLYTGAVKNMFGFLTTGDRANAHTFSGVSAFSSVLVDIYSSITPDLNIMDAVVGMEGTGPSQGKPVQLGWMLASPDAVALDAVAAAAAGFKPGEILSISFAGKRGLGAANLNEINVHGLSIEKARRRLKRPARAVSTLMPFLGGPLTEMTQVRPRINAEECKKCRRCVEVCPAGAINTKADFKINDDVCILCYCCHEMCEYGAVELKKPFLVRVAETLMPR